MLARRNIIRFAALGIAAYAVAMVWTIPASVAVRNQPWRTGVAGTIWHGEVGVAGGSTLEWHWAPLRSLVSLGFAADWRATGPDTDIGGRVLARPGGRVLVENASGRAHAGLLRAIQPNLPFTCAMAMQVELPRVAIGGGERAVEGTIATEPGSCAPKAGGAAGALPALQLKAEHIGTSSRITLTPRAQQRRILLDATLAEGGGLDFSLTPEGAALMPFVGLPGGTRMQGEL